MLRSWNCEDREFQTLEEKKKEKNDRKEEICTKKYLTRGIYLLYKDFMQELYFQRRDFYEFVSYNVATGF